MRRWRVGLWLLALLSTCSVVLAVEGTLHVHSKFFSDGLRLPPQVISRAELAGSDFLGESDHWNTLCSPPTKTLKEAQFAAYRRAFQTNRLPVLLGAEFSARYDKGNSHIGAYGREPIKYDRELEALNGKRGVQQQLLDELAARGYLLVANHPFKKLDPYDWSYLRGIWAIELFNDGPKEAERQTFERYLTALSVGHRLAVVGGCDSHTPADPEDLKRWQRKTGVDVKAAVTAASIFEGMKDGRTWAIRNGLSLLLLNRMPSFTTQEVRGAPDFRLELGGAIKKAPKLLVYRDSVLAGYVAGKPVSKGVFSYQWQDPKKGLTGEHYYNLTTENLDFVTSPIYLKVMPAKDQPKSKAGAAENPYLGTWKYRWENGADYKDATLVIGEQTFDFRFENTVNVGIAHPKSARIVGTWRNDGRGGIQGTGRASDGVSYTLTAILALKDRSELGYQLASTNKTWFFTFSTKRRVRPPG